MDGCQQPVSAPQIYRNKKELVYSALREEILTGQLTPGERLVIDDLAERLKVSAIPVREALQQLQADQLVVMEPYVGARVAELHAGLIQELFGLLEALEVLSSRTACLLLHESDFAELEILLAAMDSQVADTEIWAQGNAQLHLLICEKVQMGLTHNLMGRVQDHWHRLRRSYLTDVMARRVATAQADHWQLLDALRTRNPDHVEEVLRRHNQAALTDYLADLTDRVME